LLTAKTKKERCEKMWRKYAPEFSEKLVVGSLQRVMMTVMLCLRRLRKGRRYRFVIVIQFDLSSCFSLSLFVDFHCRS
jgi:hypothetical protein